MGAEIFPVKAFLNCSIIPAQCAVARVILTKGNSPEIIKIHLIRTQIAMSGNIGMAVLWCVGGGGMLCWNDWLRRWWEPIYSQAAMTPLSLSGPRPDLNPSLLPSSAPAATGPNPVPIHCNINCKLYNSKNWKFAAYCCDPTKQPCFPVFDWYAVMWYLDMLELLALLNEFISAHIPAEVYHEMDCGYWLMQ